MKSCDKKKDIGCSKLECEEDKDCKKSTLIRRRKFNKNEWRKLNKNEREEIKKERLGF